MSQLDEYIVILRSYFIFKISFDFRSFWAFQLEKSKTNSTKTNDFAHRSLFPDKSSTFFRRSNRPDPALYIKKGRGLGVLELPRTLNSYCYINHNIPAGSEKVSWASMLKVPNSNPVLAPQLFFSKFFFCIFSTFMTKIKIFFTIYFFTPKVNHSGVFSWVMSEISYIFVGFMPI